MAKLAINGGTPAVTAHFPHFNTFDEAEKQAVNRVLDSGVLSDYVGAWCDQFYGGAEVRSFERACAARFGVKHAITVNSWTSGLICAVGALDIEPGDEILVSPWTMCATATAILVWNAIPVFVDIERDTFNMDPEKIAARITPKTKAIVVPDIFGHAGKMREILAVARQHGLKVIEDAAQAPGAMYQGKKVGTLGDIGGFSLNYHKHIHTGEGGIIVTDDDTLAERMQLIRNHAEAIVAARPDLPMNNMIGFNFRLGEMEAAIGKAQLLKLDAILARRRWEAEALLDGLQGLDGLRLPRALEGCTHDYYILGLQLSEALQKSVGKHKIVQALKAEGIPAVADRYVNVHRYPMYTKRMAYGRGGYPFNLASPQALSSYGDGACPVAEHLQDHAYMGLVLCLHHYSEEAVQQIGNAFHKVWENLRELA